MHIGTFDNFTECYIGLIDKTYNDYTYESAPRGQKIKEVIGATFTITNPRKRLPYVKGRKFGLAYLAAELIWYLSANNKTSWISKYSNFWASISDIFLPCHRLLHLCVSLYLTVLQISMLVLHLDQASSYHLEKFYFLNYL